MAVRDTFRQQVDDPGVDAFAMRGSLSGKSFMQGRGDAQVEFSGKMFARLNSFLDAHFQKCLQRNLPLFPKIVNRAGIEICPTVNADELTPEHVDLRVIGDDSLVTVNFHIVHGLTPLSSSHLRMEVTAPLSVSGDGWWR